MNRFFTLQEIIRIAEYAYPIIHICLIFRTWEEPFDHAIYCLATDGNWTLVCGTARHGMVRLWDMRHSKPVQLYYSNHPFSGQSSPVYSVAFDQKNLYVALDQCLNLLSFSGQITGSKSITNNYSNRYC